MADTRTSKVVLQYGVDQQSITATVNANKNALSAIRAQGDADYQARVKQLSDIQQKNASTLGAIRAQGDAEYNNRVKQIEDSKQRQKSYFDSTRQAADQAYSQMVTASNQAYDTAAQAAQASAQKQNQATQSVIRDLSTLEDKIRALPAPDLGDFGIGEGGKGISGQQLGSRFAGIGSVFGGVGGEAFRDVNQIVQLGVVGGAAGVVIGTLAVGLKVLSNNAEEAAKEIRDSAAAYAELQVRATQSTREQLEQQLEQAKQELAVREQLNNQAQADLQTRLNVEQQLVDPFRLNLPLINAAGVALDGTLQGLSGRAKDARDALNKAQDNVANLTITLDGNSTGANDAADAEKELEKARQEAAQRTIQLTQQEAAFRLQFAQTRDTLGQDQLQSLTEAGSHVSHDLTDQIYDQIKANQDRLLLIQNYELPTLQKQNDGTQEYADRLKALADEQAQLKLQDDLLVQSVLPVIQARENEINALQADKDASDALNDTLQDINKAQVDAADAARKTAEAYADLKQAEVDHSNNLIDIQARYAADQMTALQKKNDQLAKLDAQYAQQTLFQHQRDTLSIRQAEATGNFARVQEILANQKLEDQQRQTQTNQQKAEADKTYKDQLDAAKEQNTKLLKSEQERYDKERQQRQQAYQKALEDQRAADGRLASLRAQLVSQEVYWANVVTAAYNKLSGASNDLANTMINNANRMSSFVNGTSGGSTGTAPTLPHYTETPGAYSAFPTVPGTHITIGTFATGIDYVPRDMLAFIHKGERVLTAEENRRGGGGDTVTINIDARNSSIPQTQWQQWKEETKTEVVKAIRQRNEKAKNTR